MTKVIPGRFTAQVDEPIVVFLIGMRLNKTWKFWKWLPVSLAMPRMLRRLNDEPELGLLHSEFGVLGKGPLVVQYWRSFEHLERFAKHRLEPHLGAWKGYNKKVRASSGDVGIWHETYLVEPGQFECVYGAMPVFGLAAATAHVPASGGRENARGRLGTAAARTAAVKAQSDAGHAPTSG